jgi:hypothetical protein
MVGRREMAQLPFYSFNIHNWFYLIFFSPRSRQNWFIRLFYVQKEVVYGERISKYCKNSHKTRRLMALKAPKHSEQSSGWLLFPYD